MNDLLQALYKERRTLDARLYIAKLYISKEALEGKPNPVLSTIPYTENDCKEIQNRLDEVEVAVTAILAHRKANKKVTQVKS